MPLNIRRIITKGSEGAIVSQFEKSGHKYCAIVNKSLTHSLKVTIDTSNSTPVQISKSLSVIPMKRNYTIAAGDMIIFRLK